MALALDTARYAARIAELDASRRHARLWRYGRYALIAALVAWSVEAIVIGDTDWTRITWAGVVSSAWRFIDFDASILKSLWEPALETVLMATLATILGAAMAIPIAWLGALNISPLGRFTYLLGRVSMTLSRSVHEVVWGLVFVAAVGLGALAGLAGDKWSLGFVAETEQQVCKHLQEHLQLLPDSDAKSRMILEQMLIDENRHATAAVDAGAATLPAPVKQTMNVMATVMKAAVYRI